MIVSQFMKVFLMMFFCMAGVTMACCETPPEDIEVLFNGFVQEFILLSPETGTQLGLPPSYGIKVSHDHLDKVDEEANEKLGDFYTKYRKWLDAYDRTSLTESQRVACEVLRWYLDDAITAHEYRHLRYVINPVLGFHNNLTSLMTQHHRIEDTKDAKDYLTRLRQYDTMMAQLVEQIEIRERKGIIAPIFIIDSFREAVDEFVSMPCEENILYTSFATRLVNLTSADGTTKEKLQEQALEAVRDVVYPAYRRLSVQLIIMHDKADERAGLWKLPRGDEYYKYCLNHHTTTNMTPDQIHSLGLAEVERIQAEMTELFKHFDIPDTGTFTDRLKAYNVIAGNRNDERFFFPATEQGIEQTLNAYQAIIDSMQERLPEMFFTVPQTPVTVERVQKFREKTVGTYYQPPKLDGSGGGIFYMNPSYQHAKGGMRTLAYHEAIPGHHLQMALEQELGHARLFKALFFFTGYVEGWALYAEKLAKEYGFYNDVYSRIGNLRSELFRAARLVVDTGIHAKRWTRDQAYQYVLENVGWASYGEIDRYIVWPGQACAYKIGELKILELREKAKKSLGDEFDIKEFHDVVLKYGSVPLELLEQFVDEYIQTKSES
ncbi:MAG: DUF885 domain-containing protein [candidate division WOR-3 bacterium]|nr:MAG: DUF885 domain-containing protein [candidate division WOR-3 bacterium]